MTKIRHLTLTGAFKVIYTNYKSLLIVYAITNSFLKNKVSLAYAVFMKDVKGKIGKTVRCTVFLSFRLKLNLHAASC